MLISLLSSGLDTRTMITYIVIDILVMLISFSIHEWGHAYAAHKMGDDTARNMGRMTLNPIAHIDPIGMLMLLVFGFGWAKPVPVNPRGNIHEPDAGAFRGARLLRDSHDRS